MPLLCTRQTQSQNSASPLVCPDTHSHSVQPKAEPYCQTAALSQSGSSVPGFQGSFHYGLPFSPGSSPGKLRAVLPPSAPVSFSCCSLENGMALLPLKRSGIGVIHRPGAIHVSLTFLPSTSAALSSQRWEVALGQSLEYQPLWHVQFSQHSQAWRPLLFSGLCGTE